MSVIYRSLQQLKQQEADRGSRTTPQAVAPRMSKLFIRALAFLGVFVILVSAGLFFINQEVQQVVVPEAPDTFRQREGEDGVVRGEAVQKIVEADAEEQAQAERRLVEEQQSLQMTAPPILAERLRVPTPVQRPEPVDLTKPSKALESHFAQRARVNENVLSLERRLSQSVEVGNVEQSRQLLATMSERLDSAQSATKVRWEGYLALKEKRYAEAEDKFRQALSIKPRDYVSSINLIYALIGQGEMQEARRLYRDLVDRHPMNEKVLALGSALATR